MPKVSIWLSDMMRTMHAFVPSAMLQVIDLEGIQMLTVDFCDCVKALPCWQQLLRACLFPSTVVAPQIVAIFQALEIFQLLSFMSKVTGYKFYHTMAQLTDNTGTATPANKVSAWMCMVHEWCHIKLLKHMMDKSPKNLVSSGTTTGLNFTPDANFRLVQFTASTGRKDLSLNKGGIYLVEQESFHKHVKEYGFCMHYDPSDCNQHDAVQCQQRNSLKHIGVSYDIACQWSKKLFERIAIYPSSMTPSQGPDQMTFLVPKFHLPTHIPQCHAKYSFWKTLYMGQTDGKAPECEWDQAHIWILLQLAEVYIISDVSPEGHSLPQQNVSEWTIVVKAWEQNPVLQNPFETTVLCNICVVLTQEEVQELETLIEQDGDDQEAETVETVWPSTKNDIGPSQMIFQGLEIENHQTGSSLNRLTTCKELLVPAVKPLCAEWRDTTQLAMAAVEEAEEAEEAAAAAASNSKHCRKKKKKIIDTVIAMVNWPLFLPSSIVSYVPQTLKLLDCEFCLHEAEAYKFKNHHIIGQLLNTQANTTVKSVVANIDEVAARYRVLQEHLVVLHEGMGVSVTGKKKDGWDQALHILKDKDIQALNEGDVNDTEALQIKWCKAHTCTHHWDEEVTLTLMEMECTLLFFAAKQERWEQCASRIDIEPGERAYALRQAYIVRPEPGPVENQNSDREKVLRWLKAE
ncbi:hypothetical protein ARMGADRAFT_1021797 [Armillaria gallica]|uniref:CxC2-like cysteine cluster KDZ transposase-associated domain-containing protein n=1 Tax=Armillaria gallica TaxID=47427 RepID=A0A2H3E9L6_ARMGA|nr:hypothetical protein ARMGADRAFT_1021797 [Armillaria gallica]